MPLERAFGTGYLKTLTLYVLIWRSLLKLLEETFGANHETYHSKTNINTDGSCRRFVRSFILFKSKYDDFAR